MEHLWNDEAVPVGSASQPASTGSRAVTLVSVLFETEVGLQMLQGRSCSRHVPAEQVAEVLLIDNSRRGLPATARERVTDSYGGLRDRVRVLRPRQIGEVPATVGWRSQQVLKLLVAEQVSTSHYVVLDAKNHFIAPPPDEFFVRRDGRATVNCYSFQQHPLRGDLVRVLEYLGLDPDPHLAWFTATVTPFVMETWRVRLMITDLEARSGRTFAEEFVRHDLTEFFLYSGWLLTQPGGHAAALDVQQAFCPTIWPKAAAGSGVADAVEGAEAAQAPVFAVHRRAFPRLDAAGARRLADFWVARGLFGTQGEALAFVGATARQVRRAEQRRRVREAPLRARTLVRRVARSRLDGFQPGRRRD